MNLPETRDNLVKVIYEFPEGSFYIEGEELQNYLDNLDVVGGLLVSRSYIQMKPIEWKAVAATNDSEERARP
jgi:hypothetical protein